MEYKHILLITIIIASLLTISSVNALENTTDNITGVNDNVISVNNNQVSSNENDSDIGSFTDLETEINKIDENGVLNITKDYKYIKIEIVIHIMKI